MTISYELKQVYNSNSPNLEVLYACESKVNQVSVAAHGSLVGVYLYARKIQIKFRFCSCWPTFIKFRSFGLCLQIHVYIMLMFGSCIIHMIEHCRWSLEFISIDPFTPGSWSMEFKNMIWLIEHIYFNWQILTFFLLGYGTEWWH